MFPVWRAEDATLCRYITRPAIANERLDLNRAGRCRAADSRAPYPGRDHPCRDVTAGVYATSFYILDCSIAQYSRGRVAAFRTRAPVVFGRLSEDRHPPSLATSVQALSGANPLPLHHPGAPDNAKGGPPRRASRGLQGRSQGRPWHEPGAPRSRTPTCWACRSTRQAVESLSR